METPLWQTRAYLLCVYATCTDYSFYTVRLTIFFSCNVHYIFFLKHAPFFPHTPFFVLASDPNSEEPFFLVSLFRSLKLFTNHDLRIPLKFLLVFKHIHVPLQGRVFTSHGLHHRVMPEAKYIIMCLPFLVIHNIPPLPPYSSLDRCLCTKEGVFSLWIYHISRSVQLFTPMHALTLKTHFRRHEHQRWETEPLTWLYSDKG